MAIESLSKINSYQKISGLVNEIQSVRDLANTKLPLTGGTMTGNITIHKNTPYIIQRNKQVPSNVFTDLPEVSINASGWKYTSQGTYYKANDDKLIGGIANECVHNPSSSAYTVDSISNFSFLQLPRSIYPELNPNSLDSTVASRGVKTLAGIKVNNGDPYVESTCSTPYKNSHAGSQIVVQSWIRKNLTGLDRIAPDSTVLWYNNAAYNVRFEQDGGIYDSSKVRPWIGYGHGNVYLKEPFTNFNRLYLIFSNDSANVIGTSWIDTYDLELRMNSYFYPSDSGTPLFLGLKNGISTTESSTITYCELFNGIGSIYWNIFGYNKHSSVDAYKSTTTCLKNSENNSRIICIIGVGRKSQTTWNP